MPVRGFFALPLAVALVALAGCGARSAVSIPLGVDAGLVKASVERCDGLDNDLDLHVDEDFRDAHGNYVNDANCGSCGHACDAPVAHADKVACALLAGVPACVAQRCAPGFGPTQSGGCVALDARLCLPCRDDGDCGTLVGAHCASIGGEARCSRDCGGGCPEGYVCFGGSYCEPNGGSCSCAEGAGDFTLACSVPGLASACAGSARCSAGVLSTCKAPAESCDGLDNDCDGQVDEGFVDVRAVYSVDAHNCGACGLDCTADDDAGLALTCGGDPFAPSCVTRCPDALDGIAPGDMLDADHNLKNGCECKVLSLRDESGVGPDGTTLDSNCDGADGLVLSSFYVAIGGDDLGPGSSTRPLRSITEGIARASHSVTTASPRPDVYVASGVYTETLHLREGVRLHGGYRSDFLALNPSGFPVTVVAPSNTDAPGGAALVVEDVGRLPSLVEGFSFRGRDALGAGQPAIGVALLHAWSGFTLRASSVRSGKPGAGASGEAGAAGTAQSSAAGDGEAQRAALEDSAHACVPDSTNQVQGGAGGRRVCGVLDVSGGDGGSAACPAPNGLQPAGADGHGPTSTAAGRGGAGGRDVTGPITNGTACVNAICCGLADFTVPANFSLPQAGQQGSDGSSGSPGASCTDAPGRFEGAQWIAATVGSGSDGRAGAGGGGGGAGGGAAITYYDSVCEFADGLGGSGGGGGAGGCGGTGGKAGQSGGPAIGIWLVPSDPLALPIIEDVEVFTQDGASGGDGGAGGDGGTGGSGGFGGRLADERRTTPSLAGPGQGERGGKGGDGGAGGGGGGGCGGTSIGLWLSGAASNASAGSRYTAANRFMLGTGGRAGRGGGGAVPAEPGAPGSANEVLVQ